jgi:hypothetical protein
MLDQERVEDTLGELLNVVAGSVRAKLGGETSMSTPRTVDDGEFLAPEFSPGRYVTVAFDSHGVYFASSRSLSRRRRAGFPTPSPFRGRYNSRRIWAARPC